MAVVETRDHVIWAKHIRGDDRLRMLIAELPAGAVIELEFPNYGLGSFAKMRNDASGRPTNGIRPEPSSRALWRRIMGEKRGGSVVVHLVEPADPPRPHVSGFTLNPVQAAWASKSRQGLPGSKLAELLTKQAGRCALSGVEMVFELAERTPQKAGPGCHPLSPAVDHIDPGNPKGGHQIVCYALNDFKGHMRAEFFESTEAWKKLIQDWKQQADKDPTDRSAFYRLLRPNALRRTDNRMDIEGNDEHSGGMAVEKDR